MIFRDLLIQRHAAQLMVDTPDNVQFVRACGQVACDECGRDLFQHPRHPNFSWLRVRCDGRLVKL